MACDWISVVIDALAVLWYGCKTCKKNMDDIEAASPKDPEQTSEKSESEPMMNTEKKQATPRSNETASVSVTQQATQSAGTVQTVANTYTYNTVYGNQQMAPLARLPGSDLPHPMVIPAASSVESTHYSGSPSLPGSPSSLDQKVLEWVACDIDTAHTLVDRAVIGGYDIDRSNLWIIRAEIAGELILGKLNNTHKLAFAAYRKDDTYAEQNVKKFDVCCYKTPESRLKVRWIKNSKGQIPLNAFVAGWKANGESLYVGRARHDADNYPGHHTLCPGMIQPSHGVLYITYNHEVYTITPYEVLCFVHDEYH